MTAWRPASTTRPAIEIMAAPLVQTPHWLGARWPTERLAGFAALLRDHGMSVGPAEQQAMWRAVDLLDPLKPRQISAAWRAIACKTPRDWRQWEELFQRYWFPQQVRGQTRVSGQTKPRRDLRQMVQAMREQMDAQSAPPSSQASAGNTADQSGQGSEDLPVSNRAQGGASQTEPLDDRSAAQWMPQDLAALRVLAARVMKRLQPHDTRRWRSQEHGHKLGLRQTLRRSVSLGGVPLRPAWLSPRTQAPRLFILVDVSRSMESHAAFFLRVARAFAQVGDARVFVFHTRIAEVTSLMHTDSAAVQEKINAVTAGFGAGTRIALSLHEFARHHARGQLARHSRVWVFSDGFDTEAPEALSDSIRAVRARGARLDWFHPTRQASSATALQVARPLIHQFHPLGQLADLRAVAQTLT